MESVKRPEIPVNNALPRVHYITVWVSLSMVVLLSITDLVKGVIGGVPVNAAGAPMKFVTAISFLLTVSMLLLLQIKRIKILSFGLWVLWFLIMIPALYTLAEHLFSILSGTWSVLSVYKPFSIILSEDYRMALLTSISFIIFGIILLLIKTDKKKEAHIVTIPVAGLAYFFLLVYVLGLYSPVSQIVPISLNTSFALAGTCIAIFMLYPRTWLLKVFTSGSLGGIMARQLLIPAILTPVVIGWLGLVGIRNELFAPEIGVALMTIVYTICFVILTWLAASSINKVDFKRQLSEEATFKSNARLQLLSDTAARLLISNDPQKVVNEICNHVKDYLNCELFFNFLYIDNLSKLHLNAFAGITEDRAKELTYLDVGSAVCGCVAREGEAIITECVQQTSDIRTALIKSLGIRAYACHPLISRNRVIGTLSFGTKNRDKFIADEISLMKIVADQVAIAMGKILAEKELRESETRFRTIAQSLVVPIGITRIQDAKVVFTNEAYDQLFGYSKAQGRKAIDFYENKKDRDELMNVLNEKGFLDNFETRVKRSDGSAFWIMASIRRIMYEGEPAYISGLVNIDQIKTAQKELLLLNRTLNALSRTSQAMIRTTDEILYLKDVCRIIVEDCGYIMVWIGFARNDSDKKVEPVAHYGFDEEYIKNMHISWADNERGRGPTGTAIRTGKPAVCKNMLTDPNFIPWREDAVKRGYSSSMVLPLITENNVFGSINIYSNNPDAFGIEDVKLLTNLAEDVAYGISYIRMAVSERNAAMAIKESEEKYRQLFDQMTEGFALHELILDSDDKPVDYRFLSVNPAFEKQTGLMAEAVIGKTAREVLPHVEEHWLSRYSDVALTGKSIEFENFSSDLNSYYRVSAFSPKKGYFAAIFENITQRVIAEKELQSTKNYLENLINYANAPIIVWNTGTEIQLFNHAFENLTGYKASEVIGQRLHKLFPESSLDNSNLKIKEALISNLETIEIPILTKDGQIRTVLWNSANIFDPDTHEVISTIAQGHDITERIQAEKEVRLAKAKLDLALENANIGIWTWDIRNNRLECDDRIGKMFSVSNDVFRGFEDFERLIYEEDIAHFNRAMNKALKEDIPLDTIFRIKLSSGEFNYIDAKASIEKDEEGNAMQMTGVCLDITAMQKATELTLLNLNEDLLRSNKELEEFAYVASHDLQEPLRMVSSFTQLLAARYKDKLDYQAMEFIDFAVDGAQRMQRLINDLLQYSRIKTRGKGLTSTNLNEIINQTLHNLGLKIKEKDARITSDVLPIVIADDSQMLQLFQNLIDNSIKFCKNQPVIHISVSEERDYYRFCLKDNGIGIEPQYYDRIFQIFQRLHLHEEYGGTGIGLAICKRIIERHGGKIWVESNGDGTQFMFTIKKS